MSIALTITLPDTLGVRLAAVCLATGDLHADVIADALALHLDELDGPAVEEGEPVRVLTTPEACP